MTTGSTQTHIHTGGWARTSRSTSVDFFGVSTLDTASFSADWTAVFTLQRPVADEQRPIAGRQGKAQHGGTGRKARVHDNTFRTDAWSTSNTAHHAEHARRRGCIPDENVHNFKFPKMCECSAPWIQCRVWLTPGTYVSAIYLVKDFSFWSLRVACTEAVISFATSAATFRLMSCSRIRTITGCRSRSSSTWQVHTCTCAFDQTSQGRAHKKDSQTSLTHVVLLTSCGIQRTVCRCSLTLNCGGWQHKQFAFLSRLSCSAGVHLPMTYCIGYSIVIAA